MTVQNIKLEDIGRAVQVDDVDIALRRLMDIAGIDSGDVAGQVFLGFDWQAADQWSRVQQLALWIRTERTYEIGYES